DDAADTTARTVVISDLGTQPSSDTDQDGDHYGNIHGLAPADINYEYFDTNSVTIYGGQDPSGAGDSFDVQATGDLSQSSEGGYATVNIVASGSTTVNVGDTGNTQNITGDLNLEDPGTPDGLTITVDDSADTSLPTLSLNTLDSNSPND